MHVNLWDRLNAMSYKCVDALLCSLCPGRRENFRIKLEHAHVGTIVSNMKCYKYDRKNVLHNDQFKERITSKKNNLAFNNTYD